MSDWRADALCTEVDPELFFPDQGGQPYEAKRVCQACPVRLACLEQAMAQPVSGVWGGLTVNERRVLAQARGGSYVIAPGPTDTEVREAGVRRLHTAGLLDNEIAARIGISASAVQKIRTRLRLPSNVVPNPLSDYELRRQRRNKRAQTERRRVAS